MKGATDLGGRPVTRQKPRRHLRALRSSPSVRWRRGSQSVGPLRLELRCRSSRACPQMPPRLRRASRILTHNGPPSFDSPHDQMPFNHDLLPPFLFHIVLNLITQPHRVSIAKTPQHPSWPSNRPSSTPRGKWRLHPSLSDHATPILNRSPLRNFH